MEKSDKQVGTTARLTKEDAMRIKLTMGVPMLAATLEVAAGAEGAGPFSPDRPSPPRMCKRRVDRRPMR